MRTSTADGVDVYATGVLAELQVLGRVLNPGWMRRSPRPAWLPRHPSADTHRGSGLHWRRAALRRFPGALRRALRGRYPWSGYYAEPRTFPPGVTRVGTGWTRARALRDLRRMQEEA